MCFVVRSYRVSSSYYHLDPLFNLQDLLEALNQLEEGLRENIKILSSFDKYYQEVILGRLDWGPMHKDPIFWKENITHFEEQDFKVNIPFLLVDIYMC